jgi:hypothetical protein
MIEDVESSREQERPQWLNVAITVVPPPSLLTALLDYFVAARRDAFAQGLGINGDLLEGNRLLRRGCPTGTGLRRHPSTPDRGGT